MATRKRATPEAETVEAPEHVRLVVRGDGTVVASWPVFAYRYLFADGTTLNVESPCSDGSILRGAVLDHRHVANDRIAGVAVLGCVRWTTEQ